MILRFALALVFATLAACQSVPLGASQSSAPQAVGTTENDGSSLEKAVVVANVRDEYIWLAQRYPGYKRISQALITREARFFDMIEFETSDGKKQRAYFDVSAGFRKQ